MQQEQLKTLLVNVITVAVVGAVIVAGYFVFVKEKETPAPGETGLPAKADAQTTTLVGIEIARTVRVLEDLNLSVKKSADIFETPEFNSLKDFSIVVPKEAVGRKNPFVPTEWKLRIKALEGMANKGPAKESGGQEASIIRQIQTQTPTQPQDEESLLGDFPPDDAS